MHKTAVSKSYHAESPKEQQNAYNEWAKNYEPDLCAMGYRVPAMIASVFVRFVDEGTSPILDAGCGGGIHAEPLAMLGYGPMVGIDFSEGMLEIARTKNIYSELRLGTLGETLDFPSNHFSAVISAGVITPKHAPPHTLEELIRVAEVGAPIIFSLRDDPLQDPEYPEMLIKLESEGKWESIFKSNSFHTLPYAEPEITHRIHVYKVK
jgi:SAM-dependent methyltransferase